MHSLESFGILFHFNGDFSGPVRLTLPAPPGTARQTVDVPFEALKEFVAEAVRRRMISSLESMEADELLGFE